MAQEWSFVGIQHVQVPGIDGDYAVNVPGGVQDGDRLLIIAVAKASNTPTIGAPTAGSWTSRANDSASLASLNWRFRAFDRVASSEPSNYTVNFSVVGVDIMGGVLILLAYRGIGGFDEIGFSDNGSSTQSATPALTINNADSLLVSFPISVEWDTTHSDASDYYAPHGSSGLTERLDHVGLVPLGLYDKNVGAGSSGNPLVVLDTDDITRHYAIAYRGIISGEVTLQGVATMTPEATGDFTGEATLQGVGSATPEGSFIGGGSLTVQGIGQATMEAEGSFALDWSRYDGYIEDTLGALGLIYFEQGDNKKQTISRALQPTRQDVGNNPFEIRPESGNIFSQGDFSHGAGQRYYHHTEADSKAYFRSEGFDISEPGKLKHHHATTLDLSDANAGVLEIANGLPFAASGQTVKRSDGAFPGAWSTDDPHNGEGATTVYDLASSGAELYAALGANGIHKRIVAGTWAHWSDTTATRIAWLKGRIIAAGGTDSRSVYEVLSSGAAPTAVETLPEGWVVEDFFEAGRFIYAVCVNTNAAKSEIHIYGMNTGLTAIEKKGSQEFPFGQIIKSGTGYLNVILLAGGVKNSSGGYDPVLYRAVPDDQGFLEYIKIAEDIGSGSSDLASQAFCPIGEEIIVGWSTGASSYLGAARTGIASYNIATGSFSHHLRGAASAAVTRSIVSYKGRLLFTRTGTGVYAEDVGHYVADAVLITSVADWNNAGGKVWDTIEVNHAALVTGTNIKVAYATEIPSSTTTWKDALTSLTVGSDGAKVLTSNLQARLFAVKLTSYSNGAFTAFTEVLGFGVRSNPSPDSAEFLLSRLIRIADKDRKDPQAEEINQDAEVVRQRLLGLAFQWVKVYEPGGLVWVARVEQINDEPPFLTRFQGENFYVMQLVFSGALA